MTAAHDICGRPSIAQSLLHAERRLAPISESPRLDAEVLLAHLLRIGRGALRARADQPLGEGPSQAYATLLARRAAGEPVAYLTGEREFWSLPLAVTPAVLVPRPDTETLVERALELLPANAPAGVLDLGTGSGAIALAIAHERPLAAVTAVDLSADALAVAAGNARTLGIGNVTWLQGSWYAPVAGRRFDLIVSNPPYVASGDPALARLAAEPRLALTPGPTGLEAFEHIVESAARHLTARGWLVLEHGADQGPAVAALLERSGLREITTRVDAAGHPRVTSGSAPAAAPSSTSVQERT